MSAILIYLIESSLLLSIFYFIYKYIYHKLAYFQWNRFYLIITTVLCLLIPLLPGIFRFDNPMLSEPVKFAYFINEKSALIQTDSIVFANNETNITEMIIKILFGIWIVGIILFTVRFIINLLKIRKLKINSTLLITEKNKIYITNENDTAFSFFNSIFLNKNFSGLNQEEQSKVLIHEKIHARHKHSLDNLMFYIMKIIFWFNPFAKKISESATENHEFIVDSCLTGNSNMPEYSRLLVKLVSSDFKKVVYNSFSKQEIKSRISLITNPEAISLRKKRFKFSIPVLIFIISAMYLVISGFNIYSGNEIFTRNKFVKPFPEGTYKIICPYFENQKLNDSTYISHKEISFAVNDFTSAISVGDGIVGKIDTINYWGIKRIKIELFLNKSERIIYSNLEKSYVKQGDKVSINQEIARTGNRNLYPEVSIKMIKDNIAILPEFCY